MIEYTTYGYILMNVTLGCVALLVRGDRIVTRFRRFLCDESGATAIEYGIIVSLITMTAIFSITAVGGRIRDVYNLLLSMMGWSTP
jgi:pilus assembly protein Flp/PilA